MFGFEIIGGIVAAVILLLVVRKGLDDGFGLGARRDAHNHYRWIMHEQPRQREIRAASQTMRFKEDEHAVHGAWKKPIEHATTGVMKAEAKVNRSLRRGKDPSKHAANHVYYSGMLRTLLGGRDTELGHVFERHYGKTGGKHLPRVSGNTIKPGVSRSSHSSRSLKNMIIGPSDKDKKK